MFFKQTHVFWSVILILLLVTGFYPNKLAAKESPNGSSSSLVSAALFHKSDLIDREENFAFDGVPATIGGTTSAGPTGADLWIQPSYYAHSSAGSAITPRRTRRRSRP